jgi:hypothetical protein
VLSERYYTQQTANQTCCQVDISTELSFKTLITAAINAEIEAMRNTTVLISGLSILPLDLYENPNI